MVLRYNEDGSLTDGVFDVQKVHCREKYSNGVHTHTLSHLWIHSTDTESLSRLTEEWMTPPFGHFPDIPPALKKPK